jgi:hypothetical protein
VRANTPWNQDTMVVVQSVTKGLSAMTLAVANSRGWFDYEAPVASYRNFRFRLPTRHESPEASRQAELRLPCDVTDDRGQSFLTTQMLIWLSLVK